MNMYEIKNIVIKQKAYFWIIATYLVFAAIFYSNILDVFNDFRVFSSDSATYDMLPLTEGKLIEQTIKIPAKSLKRITVLFFLNNPDNEGLITATVTDPRTGEIVMEGTKLFSGTKQEMYHKINAFKRIRIKNEEYILSIHGKNISLKVDKNSKNPLYKIYGSLPTKYFLLLTVLYWFSIIFVLCLILLLVIKNYSISLIFFLFSILFGIVIMILSPPFSIPDERVHFNTVYNISNIILGHGSIEENSNLLMRECDTQILPTDFMNRFIKENTNQIASVIKVKEYKKCILYLFSKKASKISQEMIITNERHKIIPRVWVPLYIPQIIGITIARLFNTNQFVLFYSGRFLALFAYAFILFITLKCFQIKNIMFLCVSLLPMVLQQAASYSYDSMLNLFVFVFIITVYKSYTENKINKILLAVICISGLMFLPAKGFVYFALLFFVAILFVKNIDIERKIVKVSVYILSIAFILWIVASFIDFGFDLSHKITDYKNESHNLYTIKYIIQYPLRYILILINTIAEKIFFILQDVIGGLLVSFTIKINDLLFFFLNIILFYSTILSKNQLNRKLSVFMRFIIFVIVFITVNNVFAVMFYSETLYGSNLIRGVQGRYFIPILPIILLLFQNTTIIIKKNIDKIVMVSMLFVNTLILNNFFVILIK